MKSTKKLIVLALMVSLALVLSIIEKSAIPPPMPGVKLGLANIVTLVVIIFFGYKEALAVVFVRCVLASIFVGGFLFSIAGGMLSTLVMAFLYVKFSRVFSLVGISIAGSIAHNIGQLAMASIIMKELSVMTYLPILLVSGIIMGVLVGLTSSMLSRALRKANVLS